MCRVWRIIACIINTLECGRRLNGWEEWSLLYCKKYARKSDFTGRSEYSLLELCDQLLLSLLAEVKNKILDLKIRHHGFPQEKIFFFLSEINDHFIIFLYKSGTKTQS